MKETKLGEENKSKQGEGGLTVASCPFPPGLSRSRMFSLRLDMLRGFVNEMDALALCPYITKLGFLLSSFPSLLRCPLSLLFIRRLPRLQHVGVQLPSLSNSQEISALSDELLLSLALFASIKFSVLKLLLKYSVVKTVKHMYLCSIYCKTKGLLLNYKT